MKQKGLPPQPTLLPTSLPSQNQQAGGQHQSTHFSAIELLHRLEQSDEGSMMGHPNLTYTGHGRWMIPYADMLTLLVGLFLVLLSTGQVDYKQLQTKTEKLQATSVEQKKVISDQSQELARLQQTLQDTLQIETDETAMLAGELDLDDGDGQGENTSIPLHGGTPLASKKGIHISQQAEGLVISMEARILFEPGSAVINPNAKTTLDQVADILKTTNHPIRVEGHTDNNPIHTKEYPSNWELSTERATQIIRYFIERHELSPKQLSAMGFSQYHPIADNSTIEGKHKNRRVDIVILKQFSNDEV